MLGLRVVTAVVLLALLAGALWLGPAAFDFAVGALFGAALFEWLRLAGVKRAAAIAAGIALAGTLVALDLADRSPRGPLLLLLCGAASAVWLTLAAVVAHAAHRGGRIGRPVSVALCLVALPAAWFALLGLYRGGVVLLLSTLAIVWVADIAAYFAGRAFGKRRLAPQISPGKTWAGVGGAVIGVVAAALLARALWPDADLFTNRMLERGGIVLTIVLLTLLVAVSIIGDLFESMLKRQAGVKDSSGLLPGHGGVFDRIDALIPVLPVALLIERWVR